MFLKPCQTNPRAETLIYQTTENEHPLYFKCTGNVNEKTVVKFSCYTCIVSFCSDTVKSVYEDK